jgi:O-methyltransferase domain/Dimerisation domain
MKTASEEVMDMIFLSKWSSQTLCAGAELGVFDCLSRDGARTAGEVATETGLDPTLLYRLLRALASLGLLNERPGQHFNLTERSAVLRSDAPGSLRYMAMLEGGPEHWAIWSHVTAMVRDGRQNAFLREYGEMAFAHARANPDGYGAIFGRAMSGFSVIQSAWALDALRNYDLSSAATWCDVAGGHGHMMCSFLAAYPHLTGTVLDLPEVLAEKEQLWAGRLGLGERCRYVAADMFEEVPCTADVYSLKMILHDWNESECTQILQTIRHPAKPDSRIFVIEHIVPGPSESHFSKLFDIHMMCWGSGRERTEEEYASLLQASGWRFVACHYPSHARMGIVEGVAV